MHIDTFDGRKYGTHSMFSDFVQLTFSDRTDKMSPVCLDNFFGAHGVSNHFNLIATQSGKAFCYN